MFGVGLHVYYSEGEDGCVSIPNKELMDKFVDMMEKESKMRDGIC